MKSQTAIEEGNEGSDCFYFIFGVAECNFICGINAVVYLSYNKMNNEISKQKSWWKKNWKWFVPVCGVILLLIAIFFSSGMGRITADFAQAYSDTELYENAVNKVEADQRVKKLLGNIEPIEKMAILEGETKYSNDNQTVNSTIRIIGTKGKARMDISAYRENNKWIYSKINVRIKTPPEKKQTIEINTAE